MASQRAAAAGCVCAYSTAKITAAFLPGGLMMLETYIGSIMHDIKLQQKLMQI